MINNHFFQYLKIKSNFDLVFNSFKQQNLKFICALSSGQDSIFLFFLFLHLQYLWNFNLNVLYCNHLWQQHNFYSFRQIYKIVYIFRIPIYVNINEKEKFNENLARNLRQDAFNRVCLLEKGKQVLLGHTATDHMETAFFNLIRGSSPQGICSLKKQKRLKITFHINSFTSQFYNLLIYSVISKKKTNKLYLYYNFYSKNKNENYSNKYNYSSFYEKINFFFKRRNSIFFSTVYIFEKKKNLFNVLSRPLFYLHRNDIIILSKYYNIPIICDFSNKKNVFSRNLIRSKFFADFRQFLNLSFDLNFYQYLDILIEEQHLIDLVLKKVIKTNKKGLKAKVQIKKLPTALQRRYIFLILENYLKHKCTFFHVEKIRLCF